MNKLFYALIFSWLVISPNPQEVKAQNTLTPESLIELNRVTAVGISDDKKNVIYSISKVNIEENAKSSTMYVIPVSGGSPREILDPSDFIVRDSKVSPNGKYTLVIENIKLQKISGKDHYPELEKSNVQIYDALNYRHWDTWEYGAYSHILIENTEEGTRIDIMANELYHCPQKPFGGSEDYIWNPDGSRVLYVTKKKEGTEYALSTNTDIYEYDLETQLTRNITAENKGYDTQPSFSSKGILAWLQMKREGYESDKNDIIIQHNGKKLNLTESWDGTVNGFIWDEGGDKIYFTAAEHGTVQLFEVSIPRSGSRLQTVKKITEGQFDINGIVGQSNNTLVLNRRDMNHATELFTLNLKTGKMKQLTHANDAFYSSIKLSRVEKRMIKTTKGEDMLTWIIYPPDFDSTLVYPTLLYCQGGPQGALSQFYSYRWNFQLMAANGYIVVAPNRHGMPGFGVDWNEQISRDYGGQNMQDYLSAIDALAKEPYVDNERIGCIGASYGGYSAFYLAAIHDNRFKTFISHDGIFNWKSMYGTTEELFFVNWDLGGAYWDKTNAAAQKSYNDFNPAEKVEQWTAPILIIQGGKDYRVPIGQGLEAFQAAQLQGIKSRLLYFSDENHWVLGYQNSLIWHNEFYKWLRETL
jgi:dipeptidyl aminopeptidase/acylaminoacyl peptidase